jgi:hypothetical protein
MAAPHAAGAAALLLQRHDAWTPQQVKSALMSTAGAAWGNTARTKEAAVTLQGAGLVNIPRADDPQIFLSPASVSLGLISVVAGAASRSMMVHVTDAGNGAGNWAVTLQSQTASTGATISTPTLAALSPGGAVDLTVGVQAAADAVAGDNMGFIVLTKGNVTRRIPYYFEVSRPALANVPVVALKNGVSGNTAAGTNRVSEYRFPSWTFGPPADYGSTTPAVAEKGSEKLFTTTITGKPVNFGVYVYSQSANAQIDPWVLGSKDENDVQGYAGVPVNVNGMMYDYRADIEAAGANYPLAKRYYVAVDSGSNPFTGSSLPGRYTLRMWVNDVKPPSLKLLTTTVAAGRPTVVAVAKDTQSGIDPLSLVLNYNSNILIGAAAYDPETGLALFPLPTAAPVMAIGKKKAVVLGGSDNQEAKNVNPPGGPVMPNTRYQSGRINVVNAPTLQWLVPATNQCLRAKTRLAVVASSNKKLAKVTFFDGKRKLGAKKPDVVGISFRDWNPKRAVKGKHTLRATLRDAAGRTITASRSVRVCK